MANLQIRANVNRHPNDIRRQDKIWYGNPLESALPIAAGGAINFASIIPVAGTEVVLFNALMSTKNIKRAGRFILRHDNGSQVADDFIMNTRKEVNEMLDSIIKDPHAESSKKRL